MVESGFEHPYSEGSIYYRKETRDFKDANTKIVGKSVPDVRRKIESVYKGGTPPVSGVATLRGRTFRFRGIDRTYVVAKKKRR